MIDRQRLDRLAPWLLGGATVAACVAFQPDYPTDWDAVQLTLGVDRFDVTHHSPHPPGYWLYVFLGRVVRAVTPFGAATSLTVLAAAAAGAAVGLTYVLGRRWAGPWLGWCAAAFLATSPFVVFFGATPSNYTFEMLVAVGLVLLAAHARPGSPHAWAAAGVLGLAGGIRQTVLVLLAPVVLVAATRSVRSLRAALAVGAAGAVGVAAWLVPTLLDQPGGWTAYRAMSDGYVEDTLVRTSVLGGATRQAVVNNLGQTFANVLVAVLALLPAALAGVALAVSARRHHQHTDDQHADDQHADDHHGTDGRHLTLLLALTVVVPLLFYVVVHFGKSGYVLASLPALVLVLLRPAAGARPRARLVVTALVVLACAVNVQRFVGGDGVVPRSVLEHRSAWFTQARHGAPYAITHPAMQETDRVTRAYLELADDFDPRTHALVYVLGNGAHRFRHAGYTLRRFESHFVQAGVRWGSQHDGLVTEQDDATVPVPPGGTAVFALDVATDEVLALETTGRIRPHRLRSGPTVWLVPPGTTLYGVTVVERPR